jgi:exopolysaccharide biosynthesis polyprenyl glycosylphosphotransferase
MGFLPSERFCCFRRIRCAPLTKVLPQPASPVTIAQPHRGMRVPGTRTSEEPSNRMAAHVSHELRFASQRAAFSTLRLHAGRAFVRLLVLALVDVAVFMSARELFRAVRGRVSILEVLFPAGLLGAPQTLLGFGLALLLVGAYQQADRWRSWNRVWKGIGLGTALVLWSNLATGDLAATIVQWVVISSALTLLVGAGRTALSLAVGASRSGGTRREHVLLIAPEDDVDTISQSRLFAGEGPFDVRGTLVLEDDDEPSGFSQALLSRLNEVRAETIIVAGYVSGDVWSRIVDIADAGGSRLLSMAGHGGSLVTSVKQMSFLGIPVTEVTAPYLRYHQLVMKRLFDFVSSLVLTILLSPILLAVAIAVRATSAGPIFFRQERVGLGGRRFQILKFRSMREDAEDLLEEVRQDSIYEDARLFKVTSDPRVTPIGNFLRKWSLDELPQLFNVILGDMSLVGPRPPVPREVILYEAHHYARFDVKPGITGPWQVAGRNEVRDFEEVVLLERAYIRNWHLGKDMRILFETIPVVLLRRGAY